MGAIIPYQFLSKAMQIMLYSSTNRDYLIMDAVYSDTSSNFVCPAEPTSLEPVTVKIRVAKDNIDQVFIHCSADKIAMKKSSTKGLFDYYCYTFNSITQKTSYYFSISKNSRTYYYNNRGINYDLDINYNFKIIPDFKVPDWAKGAVMYQIYVDRFFNGDKTNDVKNNEYTYLSKPAKFIENWYQGVANEDVCNFYGGDLQGIIDKITYLKDLGIECIYLNPVFVSPSNHKYDIQDYDYIDPHLGVIVKDGGNVLSFEKFHNRFATMYITRTTSKDNLEASNQLMITLIKIAHENDIKVILDGVFNHCGAFNKWLDKEGFYNANDYPVGAYKDENSIYHNYFKWYDRNWPNNDCYDGWWGHDNHPKLNFEASKELYDYILSVGKKWVSPPFNADGWRLDVAADLGSSKEFNHQFWRDFRKSVKEANPNAIILAEHYGDATDWLAGDQWDTIMNYDAFMEPITWFLTGMEKHSEDFKRDLLCNATSFEGAMRYHTSRFSYQSMYSAMNELSNHDHSRFLTRTNMTTGRLHTHGALTADININKNIMMEAITFQFTWPGCPTIYYGDEVGLTGWTDPDNRRTYPWGREDNTLLDFHKHIISIHKNNIALKRGSLCYLLFDYGILSYGRWDDTQSIAIVLNNNNYEKTLFIPVWKIGIAQNGFMNTLISTHNENYFLDTIRYNVVNGVLKITMSAYSSVILESNVL